MARKTPPFLPWRPPPLETGPVTLVPRRLYILPTRAGLAFGALLLGLLVGAINYGVSLGYLFTFWMAAAALLGILHTHRNLAGLTLRPLTAAPVFAGETAVLRLRVDNAGSEERRGLHLLQDGAAGPQAVVAAGASAELELPLPQATRGWRAAGRFAIASEYPLGLFRCWSVVELDWGVLVYPAPAAARLPLPAPSGDDRDWEDGRAEGVEFHGLRGYQAGDAPRRIAWKSSARAGDALLTKEFGGGGGQRLWLDWRQVPERETEARLSRLTRWSLDAHAAGLAFGLKLPGRDLPPRAGESHLRRCLEALARHA